MTNCPTTATTIYETGVGIGIGDRKETEDEKGEKSGGVERKGRKR